MDLLCRDRARAAAGGALGPEAQAGGGARRLGDRRRARARKAVAALELTLSRQPYVVASGFGVADVVAGACVLWGKSLVDLQGAPATQDYAACLAERPAWKRATAD